MDVDIASSGPPETVLPDPSPAVSDALSAAEGSVDAVGVVVAAHPASPVAWATLGEHLESDPDSSTISAYAAFRVGYHRGLDLLRKSGWKGSGYVRSGTAGNEGFLRCLAGLARMAAEIGETEEHARCVEFLGMLDPGGPHRV